MSFSNVNISVMHYGISTKQVVEEKAYMKDKRILITGATNGIGKAAALELANMEAEVIIVGRNPQKTQRVLNELKITSGNHNMNMLIADLSSIEQIRQLADEFLTKYDSLDVLINNAGAMFSEYKQSKDGLEMTFALNHISYFLLTNLLLDKLKHTAQAKGEARIINVSSGAHMAANKGIKLDNLYEDKSYSMFGAYGSSKLANILFTYELANRLEGSGVTVNALHPGFVDSGFGNNTHGFISFMTGIMQRLVAKSSEEGAETPVYLAASPEVKGITGKYWQNKQQTKSSKISYNHQQQLKLWEVSAEITGLTQPTMQT